MPYPFRSALLAFGGNLYGAETWTMTLRLTPPAAIGDQAAWQAACNAVHAKINTWWVSGVSGAGATFLWTKLNEIKIDGKYAQPYTIRKDNTAAQTPGSASNYPPQVSLVATLETGVTRGNACRGRMFFPIPRGGIGQDGRISAAAASEFAGQVKTLLDDINSVDPDMRVHVMSPGGIKDTAGRQRIVTGVSVGRVLDTMRSRRAQLLEERTAVALAAAP